MTATMRPLNDGTTLLAEARFPSPYAADAFAKWINNMQLRRQTYIAS
jgi:hypothetical protein